MVGKTIQLSIKFGGHLFKRVSLPMGKPYGKILTVGIISRPPKRGFCSNRDKCNWRKHSIKNLYFCKSKNQSSLCLIIILPWQFRMSWLFEEINKVIAPPSLLFPCSIGMTIFSINISNYSRSFPIRIINDTASSEGVWKLEGRARAISKYHWFNWIGPWETH